MAGQQGVCRFYQKGECRYGDKCRFRHPTNQPSRAVCSYYLEGRCRHGDRCRNYHPRQDGPQRSTRYQGPPIDTGRSWNQRGGSRNRYELYTDDVDSGGRHQRDSVQQGRDVWSRLGTRNGQQDYQPSRQDYRPPRQDYRPPRQDYQPPRQDYRPPRHYNQQDDRGGRGQHHRSQYQWQSPDYRPTDSRHSRDHDRGWEDQGGRFLGQGHPVGGQSQRRRLFSQDEDKPQDSSDLAASIQADFKCKNTWSFSCYSYLKAGPCVPGLIEVSPEELRFLTSIAKSSGNPAAFLKNLEDLNSKQMAIQDLYATITPEEVKKLLSLPPQPPLSDWNSGLFGPVSTTSCDAVISSLFSTRTSSLSGALNPQPLFHDIDPNTQASSIFPLPSAPVTTQATQPLFQPTNTQAPFVSSANATGPLTTQAGVSQGTQIAVDSVAQAVNAPSASASGAGGTTVMQGPLQASGKLTQEDLEAFKADRFELGKIPETAPPPDLC